MLSGDTTSPEVFAARQARLREKHRGVNGNGCGPDLAMVARLWPTAKCSVGDYSYSKGDPTKPVLNLQGAAKQWATPAARPGDRRAAQAKRYGDPKRHGGVNLDDQVAAIWPTPAATEGRQGYQRRPSDGASEQNQQSLTTIAVDFPFMPQVPPTPDGPPSSPTRRTLNPRFVEWLMAWPIGWTALEPVETACSHWLSRMRGELSTLCSPPSSAPQGLLL